MLEPTAVQLSNVYHPSMREKIDADRKKKLAMNNASIAAEMLAILETNRKYGAHRIVLVMKDGELTPCRAADEIGANNHCSESDHLVLSGVREDEGSDDSEEPSPSCLSSSEPWKAMTLHEVVRSRLGLVAKAKAKKRPKGRERVPAKAMPLKRQRQDQWGIWDQRYNGLYDEPLEAGEVPESLIIKRQR